MQDTKYEVQEFIVSNKEQMENLEEWSNQLEEKVLRYVQVGKLKNEVRASMKEEEDQEKVKEEEKHEEQFRRRMGKDLVIEKKRLEIQKKSYEMRGEIVLEERYKNVKLLKLIVTKYEGVHIDWFRFWNQYESEIDRSELHL